MESQEQTPQKRRQHERYKEERDILIVCDGWRFPIMARTINVSDGGYMVLTHYAVREGTEVLLVDVSSHGFDINAIQDGSHIDRAIIRWCSEMAKHNSYAWGLERID